jgi:hypothetical protein
MTMESVPVFSWSFTAKLNTSMKTMIRQFQTPSLMNTVLAAWLIAGLDANQAQAADRTWTGGGGDNNWGTPANWGGTAPVAGDALFFTGTARTSSTNGLPSGTLFNGITFNSPAGAFNLAGNPITLGGDIADNQVVTLQTINLSLALNAPRNVSVVADGSLTLGGVVSGASGLTKTGGGLPSMAAQ